MIDAKHVEEVSTGLRGNSVGTEECPEVVNYVPHHGVYHPQKRKIRVVFNCASKHKGISLNDCLMTGPDLTNTIVGVLLRFRQFKVAFMADVEAMFYQVLVPAEQRDALRFLWWKHGNPSQELQTYRIRVHLFGATSSPSIANFALRRSAQEAFQKGHVSKETWETVRDCFYVDDCLKSVRSVEEAKGAAKELIRACEYGGFRLAKFVSTSVQLLKSLQPSQLAKDLENVDLKNDKTDPLGSLQERALGVEWNVSDDQLRFKVTEKKAIDKLTKRAVLSRLGQVYDPLGMAAPVTIVARILFRGLTKNGAGWDEPLCEADKVAWEQWLQSLHHLRDVKMNRCIWPDAAEEHQSRVEWQMHTFCDASTEAYAAAVYLRYQHSEAEEARIFFVFGKARVTPPKVVTVPRLELTAAKLAADLADVVQANITIQCKKRYFWSDSEAVIKYLNNKSKRFHVFVANRVHSILSRTTAQEWRHVPTELNPADQASRGIFAGSLGQSSWLKGPGFLRLAEDRWPGNAEDITIDDKDIEVKTTAITSVSQTERCKPWVEQVAMRHSTAWKCRRAFAIWTRFKRYLSNKDLCTDSFQASELHTAELQAISWLQREEWPEEFLHLREQRRLTRSSPLFRLNPCCQDGIIYTQTRTRERLPIVPCGDYSRLLVEEAHRRCAHMGRQATDAQLRSTYWIMKLDKQVRHAVKGCPECQRNHARVTSTIMADLPTFRIEPSSGPFETTGVDYFGPITVRKGQSCEKAYGIIFTCATSRAVHLEMTDNLRTNSFINALSRFTARRGRVKCMISDSGTNLEGAARQLDKALQQELTQAITNPEVVTHLRKKGIDWRFNCPGAPHRGGFWERLIGLIKRCLNGLLGRGAPTSENFATLLCECEAILNSRPLTWYSGDAQDLEPLTPNHLLLGHSNFAMGIPAGKFQDTAAAVRQRWKKVQQNAQQFWKRWKDEYLTLLQVRTKWFQRANRPLSNGDVVLIAENSAPRGR